jgi:hypothetical protein
MVGWYILQYLERIVILVLRFQILPGCRYIDLLDCASMMPPAKVNVAHDLLHPIIEP